jgi:hypothetical protein
VLPPGGSTEEPWLSVSDVDGDGKPELLLAQKNFVRAVVLQPRPTRHQRQAGMEFSCEGTNQRRVARFAHRGRGPLRNGTNAIASIFLLDAERRN